MQPSVSVPVRQGSPRQQRLVGSELERCIYCRGKAIRREGVRRNKYETVQLWYCKVCDRVLKQRRATGSTYTLQNNLESLILDYRDSTRAPSDQTSTERFWKDVLRHTTSLCMTQETARRV